MKAKIGHIISFAAHLPAWAIFGMTSLAPDIWDEQKRMAHDIDAILMESSKGVYRAADRERERKDTMAMITCAREGLPVERREEAQRWCKERNIDWRRS